MTTWVMGDLHGRYKALKQVFVRSGFDFRRDRLIFLGDVMGKGAAPFDCIKELLRIENKVLIKGNHDASFSTYLTPGVDAVDKQYCDEGTLKQWFKTDGATKVLVRQFFPAQLPYFIDEKNRLFTHGGFLPTSSVREQSAETFLLDRELWKEALRRDPDRIVTKDGFTEVFIGHTPTINFGTTEPMMRAGIWNLDTGAGFTGGKLTLMNVDTKAYVQSDTVEVAD